jgi:hypothetical protein
MDVLLTVDSTDMDGPDGISSERQDHEEVMRCGGLNH